MCGSKTFKKKQGGGFNKWKSVILDLGHAGGGAWRWIELGLGSLWCEGVVDLCITMWCGNYRKNLAKKTQ